MHTISFFLLLMGSLMLLFNLLTVAAPENLTLFNVYCAALAAAARRRTYLTELRKEAALPPLPEGRGLRADF